MNEIEKVDLQKKKKKRNVTVQIRRVVNCLERE